MKVALVHDYIKEYGGAERVLETLHEIWPDAPVYTSVYLPKYLGPHKERFKDWNIKTSWFQNVPFNAKLISPFRLIAPFVFKQFDFSDFDVVIVSATGAYTPNMITSDKRQGTRDKKSVHICYCHTPPRYLYGYATAREWRKNVFFKIIGEIANHFLRLLDYKSSQNVDYFIANSKNIALRIQKFYRRDSTVIYPPVDLFRGPVLGFPPVSARSNKASFSELRAVGIPSTQATPYFLAGGRLARPKHIDLIVKTCGELGVPLKIFGKGFAGYENELRLYRHSGKSRRDASRIDPGQARMTDVNIEFVGEVSDSEKLDLMKNAKAYIFAAQDEDFGITPVEAMGAGTPVIAYRSGGVVESVIDPSAGSGQKPTGLFFDKLSVESLKQAIKQFEKLKIDPKDCINQAEKFSKERFKKEIKDFVVKALVK